MPSGSRPRLLDCSEFAPSCEFGPLALLETSSLVHILFRSRPGPAGMLAAIGDRTTEFEERGGLPESTPRWDSSGLTPMTFGIRETGESMKLNGVVRLGVVGCEFSVPNAPDPGDTSVLAAREFE